MIREYSAKESLEFLEVGPVQLSFTLSFAWAFSSPFILIQRKKKVGFSFQAELSFRSGMREVIDVLGNYKLYKAYV